MREEIAVCVIIAQRNYNLLKILVREDKLRLFNLMVKLSVFMVLISKF